MDSTGEGATLGVSGGVVAALGVSDGVAPAFGVSDGVETLEVLVFLAVFLTGVFSAVSTSCMFLILSASESPEDKVSYSN